MTLLRSIFLMLIFMQTILSQQSANTQQLAFVEPTILNIDNSIDSQIIQNSISPQVVPKIVSQQNPQNQIKILPKIDSIANQEEQTNQEKIKKMKQEELQVAQAQQMKKAYLQRQRQANNQEQQLKKLSTDGEISITQKKKQQERINFKKQARLVQPGTVFTEHLFQLSNSAEFLLKLPINQQVVMNLFTYVSQDNTYVRTKDIQSQVPVKIFIYEDNQRVVFHGQFYFQIYIRFQGKQNSVYTIRTFNQGSSQKLISMSIKKLIQQSHLQQSITDQLAKYHSKKTQNLALQIHRWFLQFRKLALLDFQDMKQIQQSVKKYYVYEIVQTFAGIILCFIQVKMIQKMLKGNTII